MWGAEETLSSIWGEKSRNNLDIGTVKTEPGDVRNWGTSEQCEEWKAGIFWILALKWHKQGCQEMRNTWAELGTGIILLLRPGLGILSSKTAGPRGKSLKEAYDVDQNYLKFPFFFFLHLSLPLLHAHGLDLNSSGAGDLSDPWIFVLPGTPSPAPLFPLLSLPYSVSPILKSIFKAKNVKKENGKDLLGKIRIRSLQSPHG